MRLGLASIIAFGLLLCFLGICPAIATGESNLMNHTFDDLGFKAKTFSSNSNQEVNMTFYSPSKYPKSILYPHLLVMTEGRVTININNASLFSEKLDVGEYYGNIKIPTGLIQEGPNLLSIVFSSSDYNDIYKYWYSYKITLLGDSAIALENSTG
jgi:hypothetical protein